MDRLTQALFRQTLRAFWEYTHETDDMEKRGAFCALYELVEEADLENGYQDWKRAVLAVAGAEPDAPDILDSFGWEAIEEGIRKLEEATDEIMAAVRDANDAIRKKGKIGNEA